MSDVTPKQTNGWFWQGALETAVAFTPNGRRLVLTPLHQDIYFEKRPELNPDGEWMFRAPFKYIPLGEPLPTGWLEAEEGKIP